MQTLPVPDLQAHFTLTGGQSIDSGTITSNNLSLPAALMSADYDRLIYSAVIWNGCSKQTSIHLRGDVDVRLSPELGGSDGHGYAELAGTTIGYGNYDMKISTIESGQLAHVISGKVPVYCTASAVPSQVD